MAKVVKNNNKNDVKCKETILETSTHKKNIAKDKSTLKNSNKGTAKNRISSNVIKKNSSSTQSQTQTPKKISKTPNIISEHYDLPNKYDKTFIISLSQNPKTLFAFWEISDSDKTALTDKYGTQFFKNTRPVLLVFNKTNNTSFEIEINDYATNWYIDVEDANCEFEIQLGRKPYNNICDDFILIANSNYVNSPNDHILLEKLPKKFEFINIKNNKISEKNIDCNSLSQFYNIYTSYTKKYNDELCNNPSSK